MKKVSVIIPAYNNADLTVRTVESVLRQTYKNIEIIVVDDGSTDNTKLKLVPYTGKIKYVYKKNGGACSARNLGIRLSTGEYIGFLDCDDIYLPKKIELGIDYLEKHPDFGFVHTAAYYVDEKDKILRRFSHYNSRYTGWIAKRLLPRNYICNSTPIVRKTCFKKVGIFDETIFIPADWDMWLRIAESYKVGYINTPLTLYRMSECYTLRHIEQSEKEEKIFLKNVFQRNLKLKSCFKNKFISKIYCRSAVNYLLTGDYLKAKVKLSLSIRKDKLNIVAILLLLYLIIAPKNLCLLVRKKVYHNLGLGNA